MHSFEIIERVSLAEWAPVASISLGAYCAGYCAFVHRYRFTADSEDERWLSPGLNAARVLFLTRRTSAGLSGSLCAQRSRHTEIAATADEPRTQITELGKTPAWRRNRGRGEPQWVAQADTVTGIAGTADGTTRAPACAARADRQKQHLGRRDLPAVSTNWFEGNFRTPHSHSMVAGGFPEMSYTTRLIPRTSLMIRFDTCPSNSCGRCAQCAVMKSSVCTARSATTYS